MSAVPVLAPLSGRVVPLSDVPDPVFAQAMVGPGLAIEPAPDAAVVTAIAPVTGKVVKVMPHAYVVLHESGRAVLVHVGIDTVKLEGEGFTVRAAKGDRVQAGDPMVECDVALVRAKGLSACCPVVVLDTEPEQLGELLVERDITTGEQLLTLP